jgi:hypothetical protein
MARDFVPARLCRPATSTTFVSVYSVSRQSARVRSYRVFSLHCATDPVAVNQTFKSSLKGSSLLVRLRRMNPRFRRNEMQDKADPEPDAEKFMRRQA